jgi:hypothetical protein
MNNLSLQPESSILLADAGSETAMHAIPTLLRNPQGIAAVTTGTVALIGVAAYFLLRHKLTPDEREERRRTRLAKVGRIIDGTLIDSAPETRPGETPTALIYRYRIGGVTYECGQNISSLTTLLPDLGSSAEIYGTPVQVRYDRDNPADSIVISETWNGLWNQNHSHSEHEQR